MSSSDSPRYERQISKAGLTQVRYHSFVQILMNQARLWTQKFAQNARALKSAEADVTQGLGQLTCDAARG